MHRPDALSARIIALLLSTGLSSAFADPGAVLFTELGCANCHGGGSSSAPRRIGPDLANLPQRVDHGWLLDFLAQPENGRMPAMFDAVPEEERAGAIRDVAAWLGTLGDGLKFTVERHANAERGSALFREIGCIACHGPNDNPHAVPLPNLRRKTGLYPLTDFLRNTHRYRPDARMPQFPLAPDEAIDLAAHLLDFQASDPGEAVSVKPWPKPGIESVHRGRQWAEKLDCAACHVLPGITREPKPVPIPEISAGCAAAKGPARYRLTKQQTATLADYLSQHHRKSTDGLLTEVGIPAMNDLIQALRCDACHSRDGKGGPSTATRPYFIGDAALGDAGSIPPPLTEVGQKLRTEWIHAVLVGKAGTRVRPYLRTRMPVYPVVHSAVLAEAFEAADLPREGIDPADVEIAAVEVLEAGRHLLGIQGGVNCITCHRWGDRPSLGIQGSDLRDLDQRMNPAWFRRYLLDPARYLPGTLMPALWPHGEATVKDILGGDTEKQIGAIWAFIRDGKGLPDGFPDHTSGQFELIPTDRPIIQRTFLEGVGTHAILVGFPGGFNLAYDAATAEPALLWRGRFFDAYHTWFSRFAPFEKPLEMDVGRFAPTARGARFLGYELDAGGNPTFFSRVGDVEISEHFEARDGQLLRYLQWSSGSLSFTSPTGIAQGTQTTTANSALFLYLAK